MKTPIDTERGKMDGVLTMKIFSEDLEKANKNYPDLKARVRKYIKKLASK